VTICFAYFDASGHPSEKNQRQLTVAGFVGLERQWNGFTKRWERVLQKYELQAFHANKMAHWHKPWDTWMLPDGRHDEVKRVRLIRDLTRATRNTVLQAFSVSISLDIHPSSCQSARNADGTVTYRREFEACDLWAYEDAKALVLIGTGKKARGALVHISNQIPSQRSRYKLDGLQNICRELRLERRTTKSNRGREPK
jgi:hypothetical protein